MRYLYLLLTALLVFSSCASAPKELEEEAIQTAPGEMRDDLAKVSFVNLSSEDVYLRLRRGNTEQNIGILNHDKNGRPQRIASLIPSGQSRAYAIPANRYAIVLKKDENGRIDAAGNRYEEFYFPASAEPYEIHLFPSRQRNTAVTIRSPDSAADNKRLSLDPSFDLYFSDDMLRPIVEQNIELIDGNKNPLPFTIQWKTRRHLILKPRESLRPSSVYTVIVQLEARNVEAERLRETGEASFSTGDTIDIAPPIDPASFRFDFSVPGAARLDWSLPAGANGAEMRIKDGETADLQAKTTYTFLAGEIESAAYKIVPYRLIGGKKAYNQAALDAPFKNMPRAALYGLAYRVLKNTPDSLEIGFSFAKKPPGDFEFTLNGRGAKAALNAGNNFTYRAQSPLMTPDEKVLYSLTIDGCEDDYIFTVQRPGDAEFYAAFEKQVLAGMNAIAGKFRAFQQSPDSLNKKNEAVKALYQEYTGFTYPAAHNIDEYTKRVKSNGVFAEIERLYTEAEAKLSALNKQYAASSAAERKRMEAAAKRAERAEAWAERAEDWREAWAERAEDWRKGNHSIFSTNIIIPFDTKGAGFGLELALSFSPVRYISLGGGGYFMFNLREGQDRPKSSKDIPESDKPFFSIGALFNAGLVFPLKVINNDYREEFRMEAFADGLLSLGYHSPSGLITEWLSPGFAGGLRFVWDWMGLEIKYRGFLFENDYHVHAINFGYIVCW
jgi:hypothetical protein